MPDELPGMSDPLPWTRPDPLPGPIETARLVLRPPAPEDAQPLHEAVEVDRDSLLPWLPWARTQNRSVQQCAEVIERFAQIRADPAGDDFVYSIFDRATGALVGGTGLHRLRPGVHTAETGYWVRGDRRGEGLCTEAVGALISQALTPQGDSGWGFRRMTIFCAEANGASVGVARKLGLRLEERSIDSRYLEGVGYHTQLGFAVLAREWDFDKHRAQPGIGAGL